MPSEVVRRMDSEVQVARTPTMLEVVQAAISDPTVDPARLQSFLQIGRELQADVAKAEYNAAFAALKHALPVIEKRGMVLNKAGKKQFAYARYDDLHEAITPLLREYGFATSFDFEEPEKGRLTCKLELTHRAGHSKTYSWTLPAMGENSYVTNLQNAAAARSFGKRCVLIDALDILTRDTDTDGRPVEPEKPISDEHLAQLEDMIQESDNRSSGNRERFNRRLRTEFKVESVSDLFESQYQIVKGWFAR